jgi:PKD repeat protein
MRNNFHIRLGSILILFFLFTQTNSWGQTLRNGRLVFSTWTEFQNKYNQLEAADAAYVEPTTEIKEGEFYDPNPAIAQFENSIRGFNSLRKIALLDEYNQLQAGKDPSELTERSWLHDPVASSLVNGDYVLQIKDTIFYLFSKNTTVKILNANETTLAGILKGDVFSKYGAGVIVDQHDNEPASGCSAEFEASLSFLTSNTGTFTFTGTTASNTTTTYYWDFGDGTFSNKKSPVKTYSTQGIYTICLTIEDKDGFCYDYDCQTIAVNQACEAFFTYDKAGTPGMVCFNNKSTTVNGSIISYEWNFADGTTSTEKNPCHIFPCDSDYKVSLTIKTSAGCTRSITRKVTVSSYACCDKDIDERDTRFVEEVEPGKRKIKGNCEDFYFLNIWSNVNAELRHYKKSKLGLWFLSKSDMRVEIRGDIYKKDELDCICKNPMNVDCEDSGQTHKVKCKKRVGGKFRTWRDKPWVAYFYEGGILRKTIIAPVSCS